MPSGSSRVSDLDPSTLISSIENYKNSSTSGMSEVEIRRMISALYFALHNYWSALQQAGGTKGTGSKNDNYSHAKFVRFLIKKKLTREIIVLHYSRVAADHYLENPTMIDPTYSELKSISGTLVTIQLTQLSLDRSINAAKKIVSSI
jgi:hypothetical protein